jgi:chorismate mutase
MALDFGIHGLMIETHTDPDHALSDSKQQITPTALIKILDRLHARDKEITDREVKRRIARLRSEISHVDAKIIEDLAERMRWVEEIGKLKQQHNIPVLQLNRWENLLEDHIAKAQKADLDTDFIKAIFELIHAQAVKRQL